MKKVKYLSLIFVVGLIFVGGCGNKQTSKNESSSNTSVSKKSIKSSSNKKAVSSSNSSNDEGASSSQSIGSSLSNTQQNTDVEMNFDEIKTGDYSSLAGSWTEVAYGINTYDINNPGRHWFSGAEKSVGSLQVEKNQIKFGSYETVSGNTLNTQTGNFDLTFREENGGLISGIDFQNSTNQSAINYSIYYYPKGINNDLNPDNGVKIDNSKDLIVFWTSNMQETSVFERN